MCPGLVAGARRLSVTFDHWNKQLRKAVKHSKRSRWVQGKAHWLRYKTSLDTKKELLKMCHLVSSQRISLWSQMWNSVRWEPFVARQALSTGPDPAAQLQAVLGLNVGLRTQEHKMGLWANKHHEWYATFQKSKDQTAELQVIVSWLVLHFLQHSMGSEATWRDTSWPPGWGMWTRNTSRTRVFFRPTSVSPFFSSMSAFLSFRIPTQSILGNPRQTNRPSVCKSCC